MAILGLIAMTCGTNIHGLQMNPTDFDYPLIFPLVPPQG